MEVDATANNPAVDALAHVRTLGIEQRMSALFDDRYLSGLSDTMRPRYERFRGDVLAGKIPDDELLKRLAVLEEHKMLRTHLQGAVTGDAGERLNIGGRNILVSPYVIKLPNGESITGNGLSVSGKRTSTEITDAVGTQVAGYSVVPDIGPAGQVTKPTESRAFHDSERKLFESILEQIQRLSGMKLEVGKSYQGQGFSGEIHIRTEMQPCDSCADVIAKFEAMFGSDITVTVEHGVTYP